MFTNSSRNILMLTKEVHLMRTLAIILSEPLSRYSEKGEIKRNYYNPGNYFDAVHFLSPTVQDIASREIQVTVGTARLFIHPIGKLSWKNPFSFFAQRNRIRSVMEKIKPDIIRAYDPSIGGYYATHIGKQLHIPSVLSIHIHPDEQRRFSQRFKLSILLFVAKYFFEPLALQRASKIICVTHFVQGYALRKLGNARITNAGKITVIYNKVDTAQFIPRKPKPRSSLPLTVLSVGRLDPQKYQECLIRAIKDLDIRLILIGQGSEEQRLKKLCAEFGIEDRVAFIPSVPNRKIHTYYQNADLFAIATHYEGFCIPVLEAMASGLPVIASDIPPIREILGDAGMLVPNTSEAFRFALQQMIDSRPLRAQFGRKARKRALQFSGTRMEKKEQQLYSRLLQR